jgi:hypothetical protein
METPSRVGEPRRLELYEEAHQDGVKCAAERVKKVSKSAAAPGEDSVRVAIHDIDAGFYGIFTRSALELMESNARPVCRSF